MKRKRGWLLFRVACLVFLLGTVLLAIPAQAQSRAYVTISGQDSVWVIDTRTNTLVTFISVGASPTGVAITPDGTRAYVANDSFSGSVSVIDTTSNTVVATIAVGGYPGGIAITPDGTRAYVTNSYSNSSR